MVWPCLHPEKRKSLERIGAGLILENEQFVELALEALATHLAILRRSGKGGIFAVGNNRKAAFSRIRHGLAHDPSVRHRVPGDVSRQLSEGHGASGEGHRTDEHGHRPIEKTGGSNGA